MGWTYNGEEVTEVPEGAYGFVYLITCTENGRMYIGRKYATRSKTFQKNKKKKKTRVESDWKEYWSSSPELLSDIESLGADRFSREIITWCYSRAECNYVELKEQYVRGVLEDDRYYNSNISSRHFKRIVRKFPSVL